jgi:hypothetical protein
VSAESKKSGLLLPPSAAHELLVQFTDEAEENRCRHLKCIPKFDETESHFLKAAEVRALWPRFVGICPDCEKHVTCYASYVHLLAGDW